MLPGGPRRRIEPAARSTPDADGGRTRRRDFLSLIGAGAFVLPRALHAQQKAMPVIGSLSATSSGWAAPLAAFRKGLSDTGYVEGQNLAIEYRWAEDHYERLPALAADLVGRKVDVIFASGG